VFSRQRTRPATDWWHVECQDVLSITRFSRSAQLIPWVVRLTLHTSLYHLCQTPCELSTLLQLTTADHPGQAVIIHVYDKPSHRSCAVDRKDSMPVMLVLGIVLFDTGKWNWYAGDRVSRTHSRTREQTGRLSCTLLLLYPAVYQGHHWVFLREPPKAGANLHYASTEIYVSISVCRQYADEVEEVVHGLQCSIIGPQNMSWGRRRTCWLVHNFRLLQTNSEAKMSCSSPEMVKELLSIVQSVSKYRRSWTKDGVVLVYRRSWTKDGWSWCTESRELRTGWSWCEL